MNQENEIPDGCEAKIVGNKVVFVPKESEDERVLNALITHISIYEGDFTTVGVTRLEMLDWLEKLKKPLTPEEKMNHPLYLEGFDVGKKVGESLKEQKPLSTEETELNSIAFLEQLGYTCVPPGAEKKPKLEIYARTKSKSFMESYMKGRNDAMEAIKREQKLAEWSEEDEAVLDALIRRLEGEDIYVSPHLAVECLKSIRTQPKKERDPIEIKYGGKIYQVHGVRTLPGGATGYIIEDEPGHYDCIINPEEVLGGGYGVKQNGSPYPTNEATFDYTHWGPSEEQITAVEAAYSVLNSHDLWGEDEHLPILRSLINDLKKLCDTE